MAPVAAIVISFFLLAEGIAYTSASRSPPKVARHVAFVSSSNTGSPQLIPPLIRPTSNRCRFRSAGSWHSPCSEVGRRAAWHAVPLEPIWRNFCRVRREDDLGSLACDAGSSKAATGIAENNVLVDGHIVEREATLDAFSVEPAVLGAVALVFSTFLATPHAAAAASELVAQAATPGAADIGAVLAKAGRASVGGGLSGAAAAIVQVLSLMWLRTTMNFQYKNGGSTRDALETLWNEGGVPRLYRGVSFALIQGPLSRFGDTAANVGVLALLEAFESTRSLPLPVKSAAGSFAAGAWRIALTPIDTYKTTLQVAGQEGTKQLQEKVTVNGPGVLFEGALATATATFVGHYPWYFTYNSLGAWLPAAPAGDALLKLGRQAFLGLCSSCVSDCCSNSIRVVKTTKQTSPMPVSYPEAFRQVVAEDGLAGLFVRGLQTRIAANALQGALFAVAWKYFEELIRQSGKL